MPYALLEIGLRCWGPEQYAVVFRSNQPGSEVEQRTEPTVRALTEPAVALLLLFDQPLVYSLSSLL
jgi:hypothetical protein